VAVTKYHLNNWHLFQKTSAFVPNGTSDAKRASRASPQPTNSKLHGRNFELELELDDYLDRSHTC